MCHCEGTFIKKATQRFAMYFRQFSFKLNALAKKDDSVSEEAPQEPVPLSVSEDSASESEDEEPRPKYRYVHGVGYIKIK